MKKIILITGASSGFGKFAAIALIKNGHTVYGAARRVELMQDLVDIGGHAIKMDVTLDDSVKEGINQIINEQGKIDVLVNNAGYGSYAFQETADIEQMKRMFDVNVWGMVRVSQAVLPHMRKAKSGTIINISSLVGKLSMAFLGFYSSSKHAVEALSDALRQEVGRFGINVSIIEPGVFQTGFEGVVLDELKEVDAGESYQTILDNFIPVFKDMYAKAPNTDAVIKAISHAINSSKPKTRYRVGTDAKGFIAFRKILNDRTYDKIVLNQLKMK